MEHRLKCTVEFEYAADGKFFLVDDKKIIAQIMEVHLKESRDLLARLIDKSEITMRVEVVR